MAPFISIVMPVYNAQRYLPDCLDSILAQTFTDYELICIDDGSTDQSGAILEQYAAKCPRMRLFHQANRGQYPTRNIAIPLVRGRFMLSIDCDDAVDPRLLEKAVHRAVADDADITMVGWDVSTTSRPPPMWRPGTC